jgi:hypothetical protein
MVEKNFYFLITLNEAVTKKMKKKIEKKFGNSKKSCIFVSEKRNKQQLITIKKIQL